MAQPTMTLADLRNALADQDKRLAAAFEELRPNAPISVPTTGLRLIADMCAEVPLRPAPAPRTVWGAVRC
jgi:hypothetical protein